jgi:hypothetical protein
VLEALDFIGIGWLVCDASGKVLRTNRGSDTALTARDGLELDANGVFIAIREAREGLDEVLQRSARETLAMLVGGS